MKKTEMIFILDRSGSMSGLEEDTIGGYNSMLKKQQEKEGQALVSTVLFDNEYQIIHQREDIEEISPLTDREYFVRGSTALLDALGKTINESIRKCKNTKKELRADKFIFVIITDGMENSSREYSYARVKEMVDKQRERYNWEFVFLGANMDAVETASSFGIDKDRAATYKADSQGTKLNYDVVSELLVEMRMDREIDGNWKKRIEEDYEKRGKDK